MRQNYKIFYNDKSIRLISAQGTILVDKQTIYEHIENFDKIDIIIHDFLFHQKKNNQLILSHHDLQALWKNVKSKFIFVKAAGGLVLNQHAELLFIKRNGTWDLPKGKAEKKESFLNTAIREVEEETGVSGIKVLTQLEDSYHMYQQGEKIFLKQTRWFAMFAGNHGNIRPQTEEGITEIKWFVKEKVDKPVAETYLSLKELLITFCDKNWEQLITQALLTS